MRVLHILFLFLTLYGCQKEAPKIDAKAEAEMRRKAEVYQKSLRIVAETMTQTTVLSGEIQKNILDQNLKDRLEQSQRSHLYEVCFAVVEAETGFDLRPKDDQWEGDLEFNNMARSRLIEVVNTTYRLYKKHGRIDPISIKYFLLLEPEKVRKYEVPLYTLNCDLTDVIQKTMPPFKAKESD